MQQGAEEGGTLQEAPDTAGPRIQPQCLAQKLSLKMFVSPMLMFDTFRSYANCKGGAASESPMTALPPERTKQIRWESIKKICHMRIRIAGVGGWKMQDDAIQLDPKWQG